MGLPTEFDNHMQRALKTLHQVYFFCKKCPTSPDSGRFRAVGLR